MKHLMGIDRWSRWKIPCQEDRTASIVDLRRRSFKSIPEEFLSESKTEVLYLGDNELTDLPKRLVQLKNLEVLDLMNNSIASIPPSSAINELPNLQFLKLSKNPLKSLEGIRARSLLSLEADDCSKFLRPKNSKFSKINPSSAHRL